MALSLVLGCTVKKPYAYGVFLGIENKDIGRLDNYNKVVIEPSEFKHADISSLHKKNKEVYGYINIGALEEYRPYFKQFENITLSIYEDWPDERWVDVSSKEWQNFIINDLGSKYSKMGFDGFFLDNADVYYHYPKEDIFNGLCDILKGLKKYNIPLIINGGDSFVTECISKNIYPDLFDGINQESVFTNGDRTGETTEYYKEYIEKVGESSLSVYLLEYGADKDLSKEIDRYCKEKGFIWYNAPNKDLK